MVILFFIEVTTTKETKFVKRFVTVLSFFFSRNQMILSGKRLTVHRLSQCDLIQCLRFANLKRLMTGYLTSSFTAIPVIFLLLFKLSFQVKLIILAQTSMLPLLTLRQVTLTVFPRLTILQTKSLHLLISQAKKIGIAYGA